MSPASATPTSLRPLNWFLLALIGTLTPTALAITYGNALTACCETIRVTQESQPGKGDFEKNVVGSITAIQTEEDAAGYYGYRSTPGFTGSKPEIQEDRTHLFFVCASDGLSLFLVSG